MVGVPRFELGASSSRTKRSARLSYTPGASHRSRALMFARPLPPPFAASPLGWICEPPSPPLTPSSLGADTLELPVRGVWEGPWDRDC